MPTGDCETQRWMHTNLRAKLSVQERWDWGKACLCAVLRLFEMDFVLVLMRMLVLVVVYGRAVEDGGTEVCQEVQQRSQARGHVLKERDRQTSTEKVKRMLRR